MSALCSIYQFQILILMSQPIVRRKVFFDIVFKSGSKLDKAGKIIFSLYDDVTPKTCENFYQICTGNNAKNITYKNSIFHRVIPQFMLQGGDFTNHNGTGGMSIYGRTFADENFQMKHEKEGLLSMANAGPGTNGSQFFVTTVACPWLDGKHVVFGEVVEGMDVVKTIEGKGSRTGKPSVTVLVSDCGAC